MRLAIPTLILAVVLVLGWRVCSGGDRDHLQLTEADLPAELQQDSDAASDAAAGDGVEAAEVGADDAVGALAVDLPSAEPSDAAPAPPAVSEPEPVRAPAPEVAAAPAPAPAKAEAPEPTGGVNETAVQTAPAAETLPAVSAREPGTTGRVYVVQPGDWLMQIARDQFGDPTRAAEIARLNDLTDADTLRPGQELRLP